MTDLSRAPFRTWLAGPMDHDVSEAIDRLRHAPDVQQVAVMPDVHLAADVCIGVVAATSHLIYPQARAAGTNRFVIYFEARQDADLIGTLCIKSVIVTFSNKTRKEMHPSSL